jgi:hypothetical protein
MLAIKALENVLNPFHMFKDPAYAYAIQFTQIMNKYGASLKKDFSILNKMKNDPNGTKNMFNLYIAEKDFTKDTSNLYYKNLRDLADPAVLKVTNKSENAMISDFFARLPLYAFMQTGINKTKFNFNNVVEYEQFMYLVDNESKKLNKALNNPELANKFLDAYYKRFVRENSRTKKDRGRYKNYLFNIDLDTLSNIEDTSIEGETVMDRNDLTETKNPDIFILNDINFTPTQYNRAISDNRDVTFLYPTSVAVLQGKAAAVGRSAVKNIAKDMSLGFPVSLNTEFDYLAALRPEQFSIIKDAYENAIEEAKNLIAEGMPIAIPQQGFGDPKLMPQELFVYLSKRLYQEFGFLNPGSTMYQEMKEIVGNKQGITDQEILDSLGLEDDPFTCKL